MPFMNSPLPLIILISTYLFMVRNGKKWMQHRQPMEIDRIIIAYNLIQIIANSIGMLLVHLFICQIYILIKLWFICFLFVDAKVIHYSLFVNTNFSFRCEAVNFSTDLMPTYLAYLCYCYFILKLFSYFDTVFFILRKKWTQISFLHAYHHVLVSIVGYVGVLYAPGLCVFVKKFKFSFIFWFFCNNLSCQVVKAFFLRSLLCLKMPLCIRIIYHPFTCRWDTNHVLQ